MLNIFEETVSKYISYGYNNTEAIFLADKEVTNYLEYGFYEEVDKI